MIANEVKPKKKKNSKFKNSKKYLVHKINKFHSRQEAHGGVTDMGDKLVMYYRQQYEQTINMRS